jgi:hypothetical protein
MNKLYTLAAGALLVATLATGTAFAAGHDELGTPGEPNCKGQTMAALLQAGRDGTLVSDETLTGIGNIANAVNLSVKELQAAVNAYCAGVV